MVATVMVIHTITTDITTLLPDIMEMAGIMVTTAIIIETISITTMIMVYLTIMTIIITQEEKYMYKEETPLLR